MPSQDDGSGPLGLAGHQLDRGIAGARMRQLRLAKAMPEAARGATGTVAFPRRIAARATIIIGRGGLPLRGDHMRVCEAGHLLFSWEAPDRAAVRSAVRARVPAASRPRTDSLIGRGTSAMRLHHSFRYRRQTFRRRANR